MNSIQPNDNLSTEASSFGNELNQLAVRLAQPSTLNALSRTSEFGNKLASPLILDEIMTRLRGVFFPGYFSKPHMTQDSLAIHLAANLDSIYKLLSGQIVAGLCFDCVTEKTCGSCEKEGQKLARAFMRQLPKLADLLASDAKAAYEGDPAAKSIGETIFCYPSLKAMLHHRAAHTLYELNVPLIPRIIAEMAHSATGIDIHPGARIGKNFFIDHGTGVVIGETAIVGDNCRLYQGVTLGALSFPKNGDGTLVKGIARHPRLENNVTVYAGATILGRITIGKNSVIGGNVWITENVAPDSIVTRRDHAK